MVCNNGLITPTKSKKKLKMTEKMLHAIEIISKLEKMNVSENDIEEIVIMAYSAIIKRE